MNGLTSSVTRSCPTDVGSEWLLNDGSAEEYLLYYLSSYIETVYFCICLTVYDFQIVSLFYNSLYILFCIAI